MKLGPFIELLAQYQHETEQKDQTREHVLDFARLYL